MATFRVIWRGEEFSRRVRGVLQGRAQRAANIIIGDTQKRVSVPFPPASRPGEPPHRRTGTLLRSIGGKVTATASAIEVTIFAAAPYADILDPGIRSGVRGAGGRFRKRKTARRPFLGLPQDIAKMKRIILGG